MSIIDAALLVISCCAWCLDKLLQDNQDMDIIPLAALEANKNSCVDFESSASCEVFPLLAAKHNVAIISSFV